MSQRQTHHLGLHGHPYMYVQFLYIRLLSSVPGIVMKHVVDWKCNIYATLPAFLKFVLTVVETLGIIDRKFLVELDCRGASFQ